MIARVVGVQVREEPKRKLPWGLFVDARIGGERVSGTKFFSTKAEAEAHYEVAAADIARRRAEAARRKAQGLAVAPLPVAPKHTELFEPMALRWLEQTIRPPRRKASTYRDYGGLLRNHLFPIMRAWPVSDDVMTTQRLTAVLGPQLHAKGTGIKRRLKAQSVLSGFFGWALQQLPAKVLSRNPVQNLGVDALRQDDEFEIELDTLPNPMTRQQLEDFLAWMKEHRDATLYRLFLWLGRHGSRLNEALALQWDRLDLTLETGHIRETFSGAQRWVEIQAEKASTHKGKEGRGLQPTKTRQAQQHINLDPEVCRELALQKTENLEAWMKRGAYGDKPTHVFLNATDSQPLRSGDRIYDAFHDGCTALGLLGDTGEPFTPHDLRATFITLAILDGYDIGWVARMVGHKGETTIRKHYYRWIHQAAENPFRRGVRR